MLLCLCGDIPPILREKSSESDIKRLKPATKSPHMAQHTLESDIQPDAARREAAQAQHDHADVPERPVVVPKRKIQAVQAVVYPALHALTVSEPSDHLAHLWIDVKPRTVRIRKLDAKNR